MRWRSRIASPTCATAPALLATSRRSRRSARSFVSQLSLVQTQAMQLQNMVALYRALGGGWREASEVQAVSNPEIPPPR